MNVVSTREEQAAGRELIWRLTSSALFTWVLMFLQVREQSWVCLCVWERSEAKLLRGYWCFFLKKLLMTPHTCFSGQSREHTNNGGEKIVSVGLIATLLVPTVLLFGEFWSIEKVSELKKKKSLSLIFQLYSESTLFSSSIWNIPRTGKIPMNVKPTHCDAHQPAGGGVITENSLLAKCGIFVFYFSGATHFLFFIFSLAALILSSNLSRTLPHLKKTKHGCFIIEAVYKSYKMRSSSKCKSISGLL